MGGAHRTKSPSPTAIAAKSPEATAADDLSASHGIMNPVRASFRHQSNILWRKVLDKRFFFFVTLSNETKGDGLMNGLPRFVNCVSVLASPLLAVCRIVPFTAALDVVGVCPRAALGQLKSFKLSIGCLVVLCFMARSVHADIIIDDFNDPVHIVSPAMQNVFVNTTGVGDLNALRKTRLAEGGANPDARLDISNSVARVELTALNPRPNGLLPVVAAQFLYTFPPADLSSGNAFFLDFNLVTGPTPPEFVRVLIFDNDPRFSYYATYSPIPAGGGFSAVLPFADFIRRDGVPWPVNFRSIKEVDLEIYGRGLFGGPLDQGWTADVERFYVGTVPEPGGAAWLVLLFLRYRRPTCARSSLYL